MLRVYVSSTFDDLHEYRLGVQQFLRKAGMVDVAMDHYVSEDLRPLDKCIADVRSCDLYIGLFAWRYGFVPLGHTQSITELEYREAGKHNIPRLLFLLHEDTPWKRAHQDKVTGDADGGQKIANFREELQHSALLSFFQTKDDLVNSLAASLHRWLSSRKDVRPASPLEPPIDSGPLRRYLDAIVHPREAVEKYYVQLAGTTKQHRATPPTEWPHELLPSSFRVIPRRTGDVTPVDRGLDSIEEALRLHPRFLLLGEPGSGKTTTLKQLRLSAARDALRDPSARVPLLIHLADWPESIADVRSLLVHESQVQGLPLVPLGQLLLLLDGINEINPGLWADRVEAIDRWSLDHPDIPLVLSSRRGHDFRGRLETFPIVEIHELDDARVESFLVKYLGPGEAPRLLEQLGGRRSSVGTQRILPLARNPFQLSLLCYVYLVNDRRLPANRGHLFRDFVQALYQREADRKNHLGISPEVMWDAFGQVAVGMLETRVSTSIDLAWAVKRLPAGVNADALWRLGVQSSLIRLTKSGRFLQFAHQLVQEYFAAEYLAHHPERLAQYLQPPTFVRGQRLARPIDEIVFLLVGLGDTENVLRALANVDPFLSADALRHATLAGLPDGARGTSVIIAAGLARALETGEEDEERAAVGRLVGLDRAAVPALDEVLRAGNPRARRRAVSALREIRCVEAIDCIAQALSSKYKWVRRDAGDALTGMTGDDRRLLTAYITDVLPTKTAGLRTELALTLFELFHDDLVMVGLVSRQTKESIPDEWWDASPNKGNDRPPGTASATLLVPSGNSRLLYLRSKYPLSHRDRVELENLSRYASPDQLLTRLGTANVSLARGIVRLLAQQGEGILALLLDHLPGKPDTLRRRIPRILGLIGNPAAVEGLLPLCQDVSFRVRVSTIGALGMLKDPRTRDVIRNSLQDPQADVRVQAIRALCRFEDRAMIGAIRELLRDPNEDVRSNAMKASLLLGSPTIPQDAVASLCDSHPAVRCVAVKALGAVADRAHMRHLQPLQHDPSPDVRTIVLATLSAHGYPFSEVEIQSALRDPAEPVRLAAVRAMGNTRNRAYLEILLTLLAADVPALRAAAAQGLGLIGDASVANQLDTLLSDPSPRVRTVTLQALVRLTGVKAFERVVPFLFDQHRGVRETALLLLESYGTIITPADAAADPNAGSETIRKLAQGDARQSLPELLGYLFDIDPLVRLQAARSIEGHADARSLVVLRLVAKRDPDPAVRDSMTQAIARILGK